MLISKDPVPNFRNLFYFTNGSMGDFLMVLLFAQEIKKTTPAININIITPRNKKIFEELSINYSFIIYKCNLNSFSGLWNYSKISLKYLFSRNLVITPHTSGVFPLYIKLFAHKISLNPKSLLVGYEDTSILNKYIYDKVFTFNENILIFESMMNLARELGFSVENKTPQLSLPEDFSVLDKFNLKDIDFVILHPCGSSKIRSLDHDEIVSVIKTLLQKNQGIKVVLTGNEKDYIHIGDLPEGIKENILNLSGKVSLKGLISLIKASKTYIGVDTGISHIASIFGIKSLIISHSASVYYWLPYYNPRSTIIYSINNCKHDIHEGLEHLKTCYNEKNNYLLKVPIKYLEDFLYIS